MEERKQSWTVVTATGIKSTAVTPVMFRAANTNTNTNPPSSVSNSLLFHFNTFRQSDKTKCTELRSLEIQLHGVLKSFALTVWSPYRQYRHCNTFTGWIARLCRYYCYSRADFSVFRPTGATLCTDQDEISQQGGDRRSAPCQILSGSI